MSDYLNQESKLLFILNSTESNQYLFQQINLRPGNDI